MKAADISDELFMEGIRTVREPNRIDPTIYGWVTRWDLGNWLTERLGADVPQKIVLAKARKLIRRKFIDGCACGCRGDFEIPGETPIATDVRP